MFEDAELEKWEAELAEATREATTARAALAEAQARADNAGAREHAAQQVVAGLRAYRASIRPQKERLPVEADSEAIHEARRGGAVVTHSGAEQQEPPRGMEAVRRVLAETQRNWQITDLTHEIDTRGWIRPDAKHKRAAVAAAVKRLVELGEVERSGYGQYRYSGATASENGATTRDVAETLELGEEVG